jgi:hypothetical protein
MHERGLACEANCGVALTQLAAECSRRWQPLSYMFVDVKSGKVIYVGTTKDLQGRMWRHCSRDKLEYSRERVEVDGIPGRLRPQAIERTLKNAGVRLHVALHATEWQLWWSISYKIEKNLMAPPTIGVTYRSMRRTAEGATEVETYAPGNCKRRHVDALQLARGSRYARALQQARISRSARPVYMGMNVRRATAQRLEYLEKNAWAGIQPQWVSLSKQRMPAGEIEDMLGEVNMPGVGILSASRTTAIDGKTQHAWAVSRLNRSSKDTVGKWPLLRQGECDKLGFFGYCRCRVPCGQRWVLAGEPEERRRMREDTLFAAWRDPWRKHGVMGADDEEIADKVEIAMEIQEESERRRNAGEPSNTRWKELSALTQEITAMRARDFYGAAALESADRIKTALPDEKYMQDRAVARVCRDRRGYMCRFEYREILPGEMGGGAAHMQMHAWDQWCGLCPGFYLK